MVSFKTVAGSITTIKRKTLRFVCFSDEVSGRLRIDMAATSRGR